MVYNQTQHCLTSIGGSSAGDVLKTLPGGAESQVGRSAVQSSLPVKAPGCPPYNTPGRPNLVSLSRTFGSVGDTSEQILDSKTPLPQFPREEEASATDPRKGDPLDTAADMQNLMQPSGSDGSGGDTKPTTASHGGDPEKQPKGEEITAVKEEVDWSDLDQDKETTTPPRIKGDKSDRSWRDLPENKGGANNHVPQSCYWSSTMWRGPQKGRQPPDS